MKLVKNKNGSVNVKKYTIFIFNIWFLKKRHSVFMTLDYFVEHLVIQCMILRHQLSLLIEHM